MKTLNEITTNELETIFNAVYRKRETVNQFGQQIKNPNLSNFEDDALFDTLDLLKHLSNESYDTFDLTGFDMYSNEVYDILEYNFGCIEEVAHINTYNWSAPVTNDLDFKVYKSDTNTILEVNVHNGYSDVRCGYGISFLFIFDLVEDWIYLFEDVSYKSFDLEGYSFDFSLFSESGVYSVYDHENNEDVEYDVYIGDLEDCKEYIANLKKEGV